MVIIDDIGKMAFVCKRIEDIWWKNYWLDEQTSTHPTQITVWKTSLTSFKSEMDGWTTSLSIKSLHDSWVNQVKITPATPHTLHAMEHKQTKILMKSHYKLYPPCRGVYLSQP